MAIEGRRRGFNLNNGIIRPVIRLESEQREAHQVIKKKKRKEILFPSLLHPPNHLSHTINMVLAMTSRVWAAFNPPPSPAKKDDALKFGILGAANIA